MKQQKLQRGFQMQDSTWIMSEGGPLIIMSQKQLCEWGGVLSRQLPPSKFSNDYEEACNVTDFVSKIVVGGRDAIILGDAPYDSRFWKDVERTYIIRVMYCAENFSEDLHMAQMPINLFDHPEEDLTVYIERGEWVMFDSAEPGDDPDKKFAVQTFEGGAYRILTQRYEPDLDTSLILHRFDRLDV